MPVTLPAVTWSTPTPVFGWASGDSWLVYDAAFGPLAKSSAPASLSVTDNGDGTLTLDWGDVGDLGLFSYVEVRTVNPSDGKSGLRCLVPILSLLATATRDANYGVTVNITADSAQPYYSDLSDQYFLPLDIEIDTFEIDWGDGNASSNGPDTSVFSPDTSTPDEYDATGSGSHTFAGPGTSTGITITATMVGQQFPVRTAAPNIPPRAAFTITGVKDRTAFLDASASDDIDGSIVDYSWSYGGAGVEGGTPPVYPDYTYDHYGNKTIGLTVTDDRGATDSVSHSTTIHWPNRAAALDVHGRIWANEPSSATRARKVRCYWHPEDTSKFDAGVSVVHFPDGDGADEYPVAALWFDTAQRLWALFYGTSGAFYVGYNDKGFRSEVDGEALPETQLLFNGVEVREGEFTVFEGDIRGAAGCNLREGGHVAAGVDFETLEIKASRTLDGVDASNWSDAFVIDTLADGVNCDLVLFQQEFSTQLVLMHPHSGRRWISDNSGEDWTETTAP